MNNYYASNSILRDMEQQTRKFHIHLIKGISQDVIKVPELAHQMISKYLKKHVKSNTNPTIRPPRIYKDLTEEETITQYETAELEKYLDDTTDEEDLEDLEDLEDIYRCHYMVHYNGKIRQCRKAVLDDSEFCGIHDNELVYPFGIKDDNNKKSIKINYPNSDRDPNYN